MDNIFTGLNITLDGQSAMRGDINGFLDTEGQEAARITRASVDSIQEIDYANSGYTAETGHSLGPQMNIITKSGTNSFHGELFEFFRNDALDAKDYFATSRQPLKLNQFGGNFGGPIVKNKLFFFVNYEGDRTHITAHQRSESHAERGRSSAIRAVHAASIGAVCASSGGLYRHSGASVNVWAPPASQTLIQRWVRTWSMTRQFFPIFVREDTGSVKLDYNFSQRDRVFFRYNINDSLTNYTYGMNQGPGIATGVENAIGEDR